MHYHLEIVLPPTDNVEGAIAEIMAPFCEVGEDDEYNARGFWDWYVIGGRWGGAHLKAGLDPEKLDQFFNDLEDREVTQSPVVCGKPELKPASQIPMVDGLWREYFPDHELKQCPFFSHFNNQYCDSCIDADPYGDISPELTASHLIIAGRNYDDTTWEAKHMLEAEIWNGVTHQETTWDGNVKTGVQMCMDRMTHYRDEYREANTVRDDWLVVTVDYHS